VVLLLDRSGREILGGNRRAQAVLGYGEADWPTAAARVFSEPAPALEPWQPEETFGEGRCTLTSRGGHDKPAIGRFAPITVDGEERLVAVCLMDGTDQPEGARASLEEPSPSFGVPPSTDEMRLPVIGTDAAARITYWNQAAAQLFGYSESEARDADLRLLTGGPGDEGRPDEPAGYAAVRLRDAVRSSLSFRGEVTLYTRDGTALPTMVQFSPRDRHDGPGESLGVVFDLSEWRRLEEQLRQAQKMEAVGRLAGGVAHDFNNMVLAIQGLAELVREGLEAGDLRDDVDEILEVTERAGALSRRLLSFSRHTGQKARTVEPATVLRSLERLLERMLGEDVLLEFAIEPKLPQIHVDPGELEQALVNLALNAREAMPHGGRLRIHAFPEGTAESESPRWLHIEVTDNGEGISQDRLPHIFEPFYTTKESGTGLGLSQVFANVKQSGGRVDVDSSPDAGTTFHLRFPPAEPGGEPERAITSARPKPGHETVLVVEDDASVRRVVQRLLRTAGYRVLTASDAAEALTAVATHDGDIDLLLTDVVMPGMGGRELAEALRARDRGLRVLFMTGYADDPELSKTLDAQGDELIGKPFTGEALLHAVRARLDASM
jgi:PAS domain S-box-containing protein